jgi:hypothetical protein
MQSVSFVKAIAPFFNTYYVAVHKLSYPICEVFSFDRNDICTMSLSLSSLANFHPCRLLLVAQTRDNPMELCPDYMWNVEEVQISSTLLLQQ